MAELLQRNRKSHVCLNHKIYFAFIYILFVVSLSDFGINVFLEMSQDVFPLVFSGRMWVELVSLFLFGFISWLIIHCLHLVAERICLGVETLRLSRNSHILHQFPPGETLFSFPKGPECPFGFFLWHNLSYRQVWVLIPAWLLIF